MFLIAVLLFGLILFIIWISLSAILTLNMIYYKKKFPAYYIAFSRNIFLILFITSFFAFGWGWFVPYSLQPSYWQFNKMCELNKLPNNEEKYNKILAYYDLSLDTLDYSKFQETTTLDFYQQASRNIIPPQKIKSKDENLYTYPSLSALYNDKVSSRIDLWTEIIFNTDKPKDKKDVINIRMDPRWQTYRINDIIWEISTSGDFRMPTTTLNCDYFKSKD